MLECDGRKGCVGEISFCSLVLRFLRSTATLYNWEALEFFCMGQKYWFCCQDVLLLQVFTVLVPEYSSTCS